MKILMAANFPRSSNDIRGGTWAAAHNLVEALIQYTDASVVAVSFRPDISLAERLVRHGGRLEIRQYPLGPFRSLVFHAGQRRLFKRLLRETNPSIVHAQGEGLYASLAVHSGLPNVYTIHGIRLKELEMSRAELGFVRYALWRRQIESHHRNATNIVVINRYTREAIAGLHRARVWEIPNAVRQDLFEIGDTRRVGPGTNILLVGGVRTRKDILTAVGALRAVRDRGYEASLEIVGPNDDPAYLETVRRQIQDQRLTNSVTIHGLVDDEQLRERYVRADVLLLTSVEESSPICLVEAMAAGLPIVSTNVGGIGEMVQDNAFLCRPRDISQISDSLVRLMSDPDTRVRMGALSSQIARSKWSAKAVALATYSTYEEIVRAG